MGGEDEQGGAEGEGEEEEEQEMREWMAPDRSGTSDRPPSPSLAFLVSFAFQGERGGQGGGGRKETKIAPDLSLRVRRLRKQHRR